MASSLLLSERLLQFGRQQNKEERNKGSTKLARITPAQLLSQFQISEEQLLEALNRLSNERSIDLFVIGQDVSFITFFDEEHAKLLRDLTDTENKARLAIEAHAESGVWARDLRKELQMPQSTFSKVLKVLETRSLIKSFKPVNNKAKKMYISADLTPSVDLTGGPFYGEDGEFDSEYAQMLTTLIHTRLAEQPRTVDELIHICAGVSKETLTPEIVLTILNTLSFDGKVRMHRAANQLLTYAAVPPAIEELHAPCDQCPYFDECSEDNPKINPRSCLPYREWFRTRPNQNPHATNNERFF